jgi:phosphopantetheine--protein transferase-like protein
VTPETYVETALKGADMTSETAAAYLANLLSKPVTSDTVLRLSSAQRARFRGWLNSQGLGDGGALLSGEFTLNALLTSAPSAPIPLRNDRINSRPETDIFPKLGVDIQSISELMKNIESGDLKANHEVLHLFTLREISYAQSRPNPLETLAGVFAAKEAIRKCRHGSAISPEEFRAIEVLPDADGQPTAAGYQISISHSGDAAVAVALLLPPLTAAPTPSTIEPPRAPGGMRWLFVGLIVNSVLMIILLILVLLRHEF